MRRAWRRPIASGVGRGAAQAVALACTLAAGALVAQPEPISPGSAAAVARIADACPVFLWASSSSTGSLRLNVVEIGPSSGEAGERAVLSVELPSSARGWSPALADCLEPGRRYAWTLEVPSDEVDGEWVAAAPRLRFEIVAGPRPAEAAEALAVSAARQGTEAGLSPQPAELPLATPASGATSLSVDGQIALGSASDIFRAEAPFLWSDGSGNLALGTNALLSNSDGVANTAVGFEALYSNDHGDYNTAIGHQSLLYNTSGNHNTAAGKGALFANTTALGSSAVGAFALTAAAGNGADGNTAAGARALVANTSGGNNTAIGYAALDQALDSSNIGVGYEAGTALVNGSNNLFVGDAGVDGSGTIAIGDPAVHDRAYVAGVHGASFGSTNHPVYVDSAGQLGENTSSARFKEEITDLPELSDRLLALRPVVFRRRSEAGAPRRPREFGLIAEEVASVLPQLAVFDADGRPGGVRYYLLTRLLLAELQRQEGEIERRHREQVALGAGLGLVFLVGAFTASAALRS